MIKVIEVIEKNIESYLVSAEVPTPRVFIVADQGLEKRENNFITDVSKVR
jgi:hypothetical protein